MNADLTIGTLECDIEKTYLGFEWEKVWETLAAVGGAEVDQKRSQWDQEFFLSLEGKSF